MLVLKLTDEEFYNDACVLVRSFYPKEDVVSFRSKSGFDEGVRIMEIDSSRASGQTKSELHDSFKKELYTKLVDETGIKLPWGFITGVRPSNMFLKMLEEGKSDQEIKDFFTDFYCVSQAKADMALEIAHKEMSLMKRAENLSHKEALMTKRGRIIDGYSLYIGIPFCPATCLYCSFTSYPLASFANLRDYYIEALIRELKAIPEIYGSARPATIYMGGGTPTALTAEQMNRLLDAVKEIFDIDESQEFTIEAGRPDSITYDKLAVIKKHGISRISINPQTMNDETLKIIGRSHRAEDIVETYKMARELGFDNINMDTIIGLPGEDTQMIKHTYDEIMKLAPDSLTVHALSLKRASALNLWRDKYWKTLTSAKDEEFDYAALIASKMGLEPYYMYRQKNMSGNFENVGYATPGKECIYNNLIMEELQSIIACGAGTVSKRVYEDGRIERCDTVKELKLYISEIDEMIERKRKLFG